jgi:hypothetical protein
MRLSGDAHVESLKHSYTGNIVLEDGKERMPQGKGDRALKRTLTVLVAVALPCGRELMKIPIVDDHPLAREGIRTMSKSEPDLKVEQK